MRRPSGSYFTHSSLSGPKNSNWRLFAGMPLKDSWYSWNEPLLCGAPPPAMPYQRAAPMPASSNSPGTVIQAGVRIRLAGLTALTVTAAGSAGLPGTSDSLPHAEHFPFLPTHSAFTLSVLPQPEQGNMMKGDGDGTSASTGFSSASTGFSTAALSCSGGSAPRLRRMKNHRPANDKLTPTAMTPAAINQPRAAPLPPDGGVAVKPATGKVV